MLECTHDVHASCTAAGCAVLLAACRLEYYYGTAEQGMVTVAIGQIGGRCVSIRHGVSGDPVIDVLICSQQQKIPLITAFPAPSSMDLVSLAHAIASYVDRIYK